MNLSTSKVPALFDVILEGPEKGLQISHVSRTICVLSVQTSYSEPPNPSSAFFLSLEWNRQRDVIYFIVLLTQTAWQFPWVLCINRHIPTSGHWKQWYTGRLGLFSPVYIGSHVHICLCHRNWVHSCHGCILDMTGGRHSWRQIVCHSQPGGEANLSENISVWFHGLSFKWHSASIVLGTARWPFPHLHRPSNCYRDLWWERSHRINLRLWWTELSKPSV